MGGDDRKQSFQSELRSGWQLPFSDTEAQYRGRPHGSQARPKACARLGRSCRSSSTGILGAQYAAARHFLPKTFNTRYSLECVHLNYNRAPNQTGASTEGMVTNTAEIRSENIDSRTATFERKRPYDVASRDDISHAGSAESTPRKRKKHAAKLGIQDLRDSIPNGGSSNLDSAPHEEPRCGESESPQEAAATSAAPPMTWNAVNGTKLRTSLGGGLGKSKISQGRGPQAAQVFGCPGKVKTRQNDKVQTVQAVESPGKVDIAQHVKPQTGLKPKVARKKGQSMSCYSQRSMRMELC